MKQIRLGTVGSGMIVHMILDAAKETEGIELTAVYSRDMAKGQALGEKYGAVRVYTDLEAFLQDETVNFVYIASPNSLHFEQARMALLAGKHVICEKPLCPTVAQAEELVRLARERGLFLIDATPTAFLPNLDILRQKLEQIGPVRLVLSNFSQLSSRYPALLAGQLPNVFNPEFAGGCLMDINYYNLYLNVALFGKPREAVYYPNLYQGKIDTSGVLVLRYDGFVSQASGAKDTWGENFFQIEGEAGYIRVCGSTNMLPEVHVVTREGREICNGQTGGSAWFYEVQEITRLILAEDHRAIDARLAVTLQVIETLEQVRKQAGIVFPGDSAGQSV